jgi:TolB protein
MFIAQARNGTGAGLWMMKTDGSGARKLIDWKWMMHYPFRAAWSPAGDRVAFVTLTENASAIYSMNLDGSDFHFVAYGDDFSWSPDGRQLALTAYVPQRLGRYLQLVSIDGSNIRQISSSGRASACAWSPDGKC